MKINHKFILLIIVVITIITNILVILNDVSIFRNILSIILFLIIPGFLIVNILSFQKLNKILKISFSFGISVSIIILQGLVTNFILPIIGVSRPLDLLPQLFSLDILLLILISISYIKNKDKFTELNIKIQYIYFVLNIILTILGAIILNNNGTNLLSIISLFWLIIGILYVILFNNNDESSNAINIYLISLNLLLMLSLRSWYISGSDINDEYFVFTTTQKIGKWAISNINHAYNACLSITILPTIIHNVSSISGTYVYKLIYPMLFAFVPVNIYFLFRKYISEKLSFISLIFFVGQPSFIQPMVSLTRQEIGFLFFSLILVTLFNINLGKNTKSLLLILFGFSMVVSHYSTTYIAIILFILVIISRLFYKYAIKIFVKIKITPKDIKITQDFYIRSYFVLVLLLFTFLWYSQLTNNSANIVQTMKETIFNMNKIFISENKNQEVNLALQLTNNSKISIYDTFEEYNKSFKVTSYHSPNVNFEIDNIVPLYENYTNPMLITKYNNVILQLLFYARNIIKLLFIPGIIFLLIKRRNTSHIDNEFVILCTASSILLSLLLFHPTLAERYNVSRLYLQLLMFLSLATSVGFTSFMILLNNAQKIIIYGLFILLVFCIYTGAFFQILGGIAYMHLNNFGEDYDKYYFYKAEILSIQWLNLYRNIKKPLYSDRFAYVKLKAYGANSSVVTYLLPKLVSEDSYVYARATNILKNKVTDVFNGQTVSYTYPSKYIYHYKNTIYDNSQTKIYK